ncbi:MAG: ABC transporter permease subunit [Anaerolineae bacterium]|nr:ABC transporter permease subunit [Anaerolineae bacterium]
MRSEISMGTTSATTSNSSKARSVTLTRQISPAGRKLLRQILVQLFLLTILVSVLFPVLWIVSMAVDPRGISRPTDLNLFPPNANLDAFVKLLAEPFSNVLPIYFGEMLMNSLFVALGTAAFAVGLGSSAAYSFSRFDFIGRQGGMLTFIVLLMLPTTGTLIPLFLLFNSFQVNTIIARAVPTYFAASLIAVFVLLVYRMIEGYTRYNDERRFNPTPPMVLGGVIVMTFLAIVVTFAVLFERSPVYAVAVDQPLAAAIAPRQAVQEDYSRRVASLPRSQGTAERAALAAEGAARDAAAIQQIQTEAAAAPDLTVYLQAQIETRTNAEDTGFVLDSLNAAQDALNSGGAAAALTVLENAVVDAQTQLADRSDQAQRAAEQATNAEQSLTEAESALFDAQASYNQASQSINALRINALTAALPYYLLALAGALIGAGVIWGVMALLRSQIAPRTLLNLLLFGLLAAIIIGIGTAALQQRLTPNMPPMVSLRLTLFGLAVAFASSQLPFAIWNLKGYFDTIPKDLEEAALIDGAGRISTFFRIIVPLSLPAFAITILFSFMGSWTEFILSWTFLTGNVQDYTLAMALVSMANGANTAPPDMQKFAAMSILVSLPILLIFFAAQRYIVSGLTIGAVK